MRKDSAKKNKGFTLIELMVVLSIISLLSSIVFVSLSIARSKARDAKKLADSHAVKTAIAAYYNDKGKPPPLYSCSGNPSSPNCVEILDRSTPEIEDIVNRISPATESGQAYNATMQTLVRAGYLAAIPHTTGSGELPYSYQDYGSGSSQGAVFSVTLESGRAAGPSCALPASCNPTPITGYGPPGTYFYGCSFSNPNSSPGHTTCAYTVWNDGSVGYITGGFNNEGCPAKFPCTGSGVYCACTQY